MGHLFGAERHPAADQRVRGLVHPVAGAVGRRRDMLAGIAPRPWLETRGDPETPEQIEALTAKARARSAELGVLERFEYVTYDGGHALREDMQERSYGWIDRWLAG
jgi:hypothetical protein